MNEHQQRDLAAGLKALAETTRDVTPSAQVQQAILRVAHEHIGTPHVRTSARGTSHVGLRQAQADPEQGRGIARPHVWLPLAASLLLVTASAVWLARFAEPRPDFVDPAGFVALPEAEGLPQLESATIVRVSLPVAALPAYGVAMPDQTAESVEAELLVAQDGQARAIRLVNDSD